MEGCSRNKESAFSPSNIIYERANMIIRKKRPSFSKDTKKIRHKKKSASGGRTRVLGGTDPNERGLQAKSEGGKLNILFTGSSSLNGFLSYFEGGQPPEQRR